MFAQLFNNKTKTALQRKRAAAPNGIQTVSNQQVLKQAKKRLGINETEAAFRNRLQMTAYQQEEAVRQEADTARQQSENTAQLMRIVKTLINTES